MYGNMTKVEKQINREELDAYKVFDNKQYALVPGLSHAKHLSSPIGSKTKLDDKSLTNSPKDQADILNQKPPQPDL